MIEFYWKNCGLQVDFGKMGFNGVVDFRG